MTWASATTSVATITTGGQATGAGVGTSTISATLNSITGSTVLTVTAATGGEPAISIKSLDQGDQSGVFYVDLQITNAGTGDAVKVSITQLTLRTLSGTGNVTYDTTMSPPLPNAIGSLSAGASTTIRLFLDVPSTVTRFSVAEAGTAMDGAGVALNFASSQALFNR